MDSDVRDSNSRKVKPLASLDAQRVELQKEEEGDNESDALLPPRRDGMLRRSEKTPRKVQWNDKIGNKLVEVLEFQPRLHSISNPAENVYCMTAVM
ncbi:uncharacterized protein LOC131152246 isoform X2 [Malania oleifera]|uniref:uncharacterized protein LOC131152246 isoform X2 n=1 Tax=Malania oleifera TaxID=397392 RepID=UPI0025AE1CC4|nr:uncharacterized protein LOC131152246 isoform X2 [Malania oleifera]